MEAEAGEGVGRSTGVLSHFFRFSTLVRAVILQKVKCVDFRLCQLLQKNEMIWQPATLYVRSEKTIAYKMQKSLKGVNTLFAAIPLNSSFHFCYLSTYHHHSTTLWPEVCLLMSVC